MLMANGHLKLSHFIVCAACNMPARIGQQRQVPQLDDLQLAIRDDKAHALVSVPRAYAYMPLPAESQKQSQLPLSINSVKHKLALHQGELCIADAAEPHLCHPIANLNIGPYITSASAASWKGLCVRTHRIFKIHSQLSMLQVFLLLLQTRPKLGGHFCGRFAIHVPF